MLSSNSRSYFTADAVLQAGMYPDGDFNYIGQGAEPYYAWDSTNNRFDRDTVAGYGYWVCQNTTDPNGNTYIQNPVLVQVPGKEVELQFGDHVTFEGLVGYFSRKRYAYRFQADAVVKSSVKG